GDSDELADQPLDARADLVTDRADGVDPLPGGIVELPVLVALAGEDGAGVAASHRDHDVRRLHGFGGQHLRLLAGDVDADLAHRLDGDRVDLTGGHGPG